MHMLHIKNCTIVHQYNNFWDYFKLKQCNNGKLQLKSIFRLFCNVISINAI